MESRDSVIRLKSITLKNIKNVKYGKIEMPAADKIDKSSVLGIYGQNGSGKTAVIDALELVQNIFMGFKINSKYAELISVESETASITLEMLVHGEKQICCVEYFVSFERDSDFGIVISCESVSSKLLSDSEKKCFVKYERLGQNGIFSSETYMKEILSEKREMAMNLTVAKKISEKDNCSYLFGNVAGELFWSVISKDKNNKYYAYAHLLNIMRHFVVADLFIVPNTHSGIISAGFALPMAFRWDEGKIVKGKGDFAVPISKPTELSDERYEILKHILKEINTVLCTIIPGLRVDIKDYGPMLRDDGKQVNRFELVSVRNGSKPIPLRAESSGIIKLISILNALIHAYSDPSICIAVDELDSGIFEYMLGELLDIFKKNGIGQMIFTSHNLRALEVLAVENVYFSTANESMKYIHMTDAGENDDFRKAYIRAISLGGQEESLYSETDSLKIARAFRKAGRGMDG